MSTLSLNRTARSDYEILDTIEGGLVLTGAEVKSVKGGGMQLTGSFVQVRGTRAWIKNAYIRPYAPAGAQVVEEGRRNRTILLRKSQLQKWGMKLHAERLTIVPLRVYSLRNLVKIELGLARRKKKYEKRETIKKRDIDRQLRQRLRQ